MMIPIIILIYLISIFIILFFSKKVAIMGMVQGLNLEAIKFVVWIYLFGLIINLTILLVHLFLLYFAKVTFYSFAMVTIIQLIILIAIIVYIGKKLYLKQ